MLIIKCVHIISVQFMIFAHVTSVVFNLISFVTLLGKKMVKKFEVRRGGLMVSALDSGSNGPGSSPGRGTLSPPRCINAAGV